MPNATSSAPRVLLQAGDEILCRHCRRWHVMFLQPREGETPYERTMLYIRCRNRVFFAGQVNQPPHYDDAKVRKPPTS